MVARFRTRVITILKAPMSDRTLISLNKDTFDGRHVLKTGRGSRSFYHCDNFKAVCLALRFFSLLRLRQLEAEHCFEGDALRILL